MRKKEKGTAASRIGEAAVFYGPRGPCDEQGSAAHRERLHLDASSVPGAGARAKGCVLREQHNEFRDASRIGRWLKLDGIVPVACTEDAS